MSAHAIDRSLALAARWLLGRQAPDGAWRSETYGVFKEGDALTPLAVNMLLDCDDEAVMGAARRGADYLAAMARADGSIIPGPHGLAYPVYTAALAVRALCRLGGPEYRGAADAWTSFLLQRQMTEDLGWSPSDREYGGWGYAHGPPRKPAAGQTADPAALPNLSATAFALEALCAAGRAGDDPALRRAMHFICNCHNFAADPADRDPAFDDGGFFFVPGDPPRNKAGVAGTDRRGRERFASYGSTTADGLRALLACGLPRDGARATAARYWLAENFSAAAHPGRFGPGRSALQASVYFYWCWSAAHALASAGVGDVPWAEALAAELGRRQGPGGSWVNDAVEVREDDAIVATALAAGALSICRSRLRF